MACTTCYNKGKAKGDKDKDQSAEKRDKSKSTDGVLRDKKGKPIVCFNEGCGGNHYADKCPLKLSALEEVKKEKQSLFMVRRVNLEHVYAVAQELTKYHILLDNQCTHSIVCNSSLLSNIRPTREVIEVTGVGGSIHITEEGDAGVFGTVAFSDLVPCNILCYYDIASMHEITWDQSNHQFVVHTPSGDMRFRAHLWRKLYICDIREIQKECVAFPTVAENEANFTKHEVRLAKIAIEMQKRLGGISEEDLKKVIKHSAVINMPITSTDVDRARLIHGPNVDHIKGKARINSAKDVPVVTVPRPLVQSQTLYSDLMFVETIPFLISIASPLMLVLVTASSGKTASALWSAFSKQIVALKVEGFAVSNLQIDGESAIGKLESQFKDIGVRVSASTTKVHNVERKISTLKGRIRSVVLGLPFPLCKFLMICCVLFCTSRLNMIPCSSRDDYVSPYEHLTGRKLDFRRDLALSFGDYCEVSPKVASTSVMKERTHSCVAIMSTGNNVGDWAFFNPFTGGVIKRATWTGPLPLNDVMITRLTEMWKNDGKVIMSRDPTIVRGHQRVEIEDLVEESQDITDSALKMRTVSVVEPVSPLLTPLLPTHSEDDIAVVDAADLVTSHATSVELANGVEASTSMSPHRGVVALQPEVEANGNRGLEIYTDMSSYRGADGVDTSENPAMHAVTDIDARAETTTDVDARVETADALCEQTVPEHSTGQTDNPDIMMPAQGQTENSEISPVSHGYNLRPKRSSWKNYGLLSSHYTRRQAQRKFGKVAIKV